MTHETTGELAETMQCIEKIERELAAAIARALELWKRAGVELRRAARAAKEPAE